MTVDASWSCLGLETCVGSVLRQIVVASVLLTATASPVLPGSSVSDGLSAPSLDAIKPLHRSVCRQRHAPGDRPDEADQVAGERGGDDVGRLARAGELVVRAQPELCRPGNFGDRLGLLLLPEQQLTADPGGKAVAPGRLNERSTGGAGSRRAVSGEAVLSRMANDGGWGSGRRRSPARRLTRQIEELCRASRWYRDG